MRGHARHVIALDVRAVLAARVVAVSAAHAVHEVRAGEDGGIDAVDDGRAPAARIGLTERTDHARAAYHCSRRRTTRSDPRPSPSPRPEPEPAPAPEPEPEPESDARVPPSAFRTAWWQRLLDDASTYELTRFAVLRLLGLVYFAAFGSLALQLDPLLGVARPAAHPRSFSRSTTRGSAPKRTGACRRSSGSGASDGALHAACYVGLALSVAVLLGATNALVQLALWALYLSFVHVGQIFYGYGWEIQLLETGLSRRVPLPDPQRPAAARRRRRRGSSSGSCAGSSSA